MITTNVATTGGHHIYTTDGLPGQNKSNIRPTNVYSCANHPLDSLVLVNSSQFCQQFVFQTRSEQKRQVVREHNVENRGVTMGGL